MSYSYYNFYVDKLSKVFFFRMVDIGMSYRLGIVMKLLMVWLGESRKGRKVLGV